MKAYSLDLRERIAAAIAAGESQPAVARRFAVSVSTVKRYRRRQRETGGLGPTAQRRQAPLIGAAEQPALRAQVAAQPDATLAEHCARWARDRGVSVSEPTMCRALARLGWPRKKRS